MGFISSTAKVWGVREGNRAGETVVGKNREVAVGENGEVAVGENRETAPGKNGEMAVGKNACCTSERT